MENVFDNIDAIDAALDEEFGKETEETETPSDESQDNVEDLAENTGDEGTSEDNTEDVDTENNNDEKTQPDTEGKKTSKKDYAFANLRSENTNLKKERDSY